MLFPNKTIKPAFPPLPSGSYPSPKAGATLVMHKDLLVLFGGWTRPSPYPLHQPERFFDEIHTYSPSKNWWEFTHVAFHFILGLFFLKFLTVMFYWHRFFFQRWNCIVTTHGPPPMAGHSSSVIGNTMVVFGGSLGARQMYDHAMYLYYSLKWEEWWMSAGHMLVTPRVWSFVVNLNLYLSTIVVPIRSNEVWVLDLEQWSWSKPPIAGPSPHPRGGQSQVKRVQL